MWHADARGPVRLAGSFAAPVSPGRPSSCTREWRSIPSSRAGSSGTVPPAGRRSAARAAAHLAAPGGRDRGRPPARDSASASTSQTRGGYKSPTWTGRAPSAGTARSSSRARSASSPGRCRRPSRRTAAPTGRTSTGAWADRDFAFLPQAYVEPVRDARLRRASASTGRAGSFPQRRVHPTIGTFQSAVTAPIDAVRAAARGVGARRLDAAARSSWRRRTSPRPTGPPRRRGRGRRSRRVGASRRRRRGGAASSSRAPRRKPRRPPGRTECRRTARAPPRPPRR